MAVSQFSVVLVVQGREAEGKDGRVRKWLLFLFLLLHFPFSLPVPFLLNSKFQLV